MGPLLQFPGELPIYGTLDQLALQRAVLVEIFNCSESPTVGEIAYSLGADRVDVLKACAQLIKRNLAEMKYEEHTLRFTLAEKGIAWIVLSGLLGQCSAIPLAESEDHGDVSTHLQFGRCGESAGSEPNRQRSAPSGGILSAPPLRNEQRPIQLASVSGHYASEDTLGEGASATRGKTADAGAPVFSGEMLANVERAVQKAEANAPTIGKRAETFNAFDKWMNDWTTRRKGEAR